MHRSKLAGFIIDCRTDDLHGAADFWAGALGMSTRRLPGEEGDKYVRLVGDPAGMQIEVQQVGHESRVHLDIETDDVDAEVRRLAALGATVVEVKRNWTVMEAPTGQRFCVVRADASELDETARTWE